MIRIHALPRRLFVAALFMLLGLLAACSEQPTTPPSPTPTPPVTPAPTPTLPEGLTPGQWNVFTPAGETVCSDGSPYAFYVYPGSVNKVVVDFEGGGACWNGSTCGSGPGQTYQPAIPDLATRDIPDVGLYDKASPDNPVGDWYHVFVSYCTADVHLGDSTETYATAAGDKTVRHNGQNNVAAVLGWVFESFSAPEAVLMTGCSAGAYGAALYTSRIAEQYPNADVTELGDCGAGILPASFATDADGLQRWNVEAVLPEGVDLSAGVPASFLAQAYVVTGQAYPNVTLAQYSSFLDGIQILFYSLQAGLDLGNPAEQQAAAEAWTAGLLGSLQQIQTGLPEGFSSYLSLLDDDGDLTNGTAHCILNRPEFYTLTTGEVSFAAWLGDLIGDPTPPAQVRPPTDALPFGRS